MAATLVALVAPRTPGAEVRAFARTRPRPTADDMSPAHDRLRAAPWPKTRWRRGRHVIGRVAAGDLIAMSQLYDHYVERVHALITMRLRLRGDTDTSRAWDLTRQTFVALWRTALTRPPDATPNEWVLGTAQSVSDEAGEHAVGGV